MFEPLTVQSHRGPYTAYFDDEALAHLASRPTAARHFLIDRRVAELYRDVLQPILNAPSVLSIEATEENKSLESIPAYVNALVEHGIRRSHVLVAIGGGIIQDITCFLAATLLRGLPWHFYPTTLLAQADSCIGSKSSINCGGTKNILGTFTPPAEITISTKLLSTLSESDIRSGVGEMLKVHGIEGPASFDQISADYDRMLSDSSLMMQYIRRSLEIKKRIIEVDEFDRGVRNIMNYGHTFGHAIEAATAFAIPHGIAVTIGMDMANFVSGQLNGIGARQYERMHPTLARNYAGFESTPIPAGRFFEAMARDKKSTDTKMNLILPDAAGRIGVVAQAMDERFRETCVRYLTQLAS